MLRGPVPKRNGKAGASRGPQNAPAGAEAETPATARSAFPAGLGVIAAVQFLIAGLIILPALLVGPGRLQPGGMMFHLIAMAWPAALLLGGAIGLVCRTGWGWRVTAAMFWFLTGNPVFDLVASLVEGRSFPVVLNAAVLAVAVGALVYMNGAARMAMFGFGDAPSIARARPLPMVAGVSAAAVRCLATVLG